MYLDILIDWITFSGHFLDVWAAISFLGLSQYKDKFTPCSGRWFYHFGFTYNNEITIYMGSNDDITSACVNISGKGCRDIESLSTKSIDDIFIEIIRKGFQISRCDLAADIIDDCISCAFLIEETRKGNFTCRSKFYNIMESFDDGLPGYSIYFGKKASNIFINIYDKRSERGYSADDMPNWTRFEIRLRHENAQGFLKHYVLKNEIGEYKVSENLGDIYCGILNRYLRFLEYNEFDSNKARWNTADYWKNIIDFSGTVKVFYKPGVEYDYSKFEDNFFRQSGSSVATYLKLHSLYDLKKELSVRGIKPNARQQMLIDNYQEGVELLI